jgi:AmiR/NasT family two-component response regulator
VRAVILESRPEVVAELKEALTEFHIEVVQWSTKGSNWMTDFQKHRPDVVFIDHLLPIRDGLQCLEKAIGITNQPFYFFLHSYRGLRASGLEEKAFVLGADAIIQKPIVRSRLRGALQRMIRLRDQNTQRKMKLVFRD